MISRQLAQQVTVGQPMFNMSRLRSRKYMSKATRQTGLITAVFNPFQYRTIIIRINYSICLLVQKECQISLRI